MARDEAKATEERWINTAQRYDQRATEAEAEADHAFKESFPQLEASLRGAARYFREAANSIRAWLRTQRN